ncbi:MAG: gliding motility-associated C-terminal domain-containing protein, partial [Cytophagales bacterium]
VDFPSPGFGNSLPSTVLTFKTEFQEPVITNIEVLSNTSLRVNLVVPKTINNLNPPFAYTLQRSPSNANNFQNVATINNLNELKDTFFLDNGLNTANTRYFYRVILSASNAETKTSNITSSTLLTGQSGNQSVLLNFQYQSINDLDKIDIVNAENNSVLDSVRSIVNSYTVRNLPNCDSVFFFVQPVSKFCSQGFEPFYFNKSNTVRLLPKDTSKITPTPSANNNYCQSLDCANPKNTFEDTIRWSPAGNNDCSSIISYNLFFSRSQNENFEKIASTTSTQFIHQKEKTFTGCYYLTVVRDGIESAPGNKFCLDNTCGCYELPNIITPNKDGKNDLLRPLSEPIFVESVEFKLFNRWGKLIFKKNDDIMINWDAEQVEAGHYFYEADVSFFGINSTKKKLKGWLQVVK